MLLSLPFNPRCPANPVRTDFRGHDASSPPPLPRRRAPAAQRPARPQSALATAKMGASTVPAPAPTAPADLSMKTIRAAVPAHCFERSLLHSLRYLLQDLAMIAAMGAAVCFVDTHAVGYGVPAWAVAFVAWPLYWWWQGAVMTGVWVLAHECGHQSFSKWKAVNDAFGLVLHSLLLVPYHSWRITHSQHHKNTNHMENDQVFVPATREEYDAAHGINVAPDTGKVTYSSAFAEAMEETPLGDMFNIFKMFAIGWWAYLTMNIAGQPYGPGANHYNPKAPMFSARDYWDIVVSDIGIIAALATMGVCISKFGAVAVLKYYFVPYLFVNMWLVLITYLQHSDPAVPHYTPKEFTFVRGALCSIDRDYGIYNVLQHHIGDTHVAHHMFSQMPFYHAQEATEAIKKVLGPYYVTDKTSVWKAVLRSWAYCKFVDPTDGDIMFYHNYQYETTTGKTE